MKQFITIVLMLASCIAFAGNPNWQDPNGKYSSSNNMTSRLNIDIKHVDNINVVCQKESKARGYGGFGQSVEACTFWTSNSCVIILPKKFTKEMLGHETLHCLQGAFH